MSDSSERIHYEDVLCWDPQYHTPLQLERAQKTINYLPQNVESVLDVGCGNGILTNLLQQRTFVVGIDRSFTPLRWLQAPGYQADSVALPFRERAFDAVMATEVVEHLPVRVLTQALAEMVRVARRYILISVPYRENRRLKRVRCPECGCAFDPNYHMRRFELSDFTCLFNQWDEISLVGVVGIMPVKVALLSPQIKTALAQFQREKVFLQRSAICPQCGYRHAASSANPGRTQAPDTRHGVRPLIRSFWPKKRTYQWWVALYEKRD